MNDLSADSNHITYTNCQGKGNMTGGGDVLEIYIPPLEEYTVLYSVSMSNNHNHSTITRLDVAEGLENGSVVYTTPCTLYWASVAHMQPSEAAALRSNATNKEDNNATTMEKVLHAMLNSVNGNTSSSALQCSLKFSEVDCSVSWSVGNTFLTSKLNTNTTSSNANTNVFMSQHNTAPSLDISIEGPSVVYLNQCFQLRVTVTNPTSVIIHGASLHAHSRWVGTLTVNK